MGEQLFEVWDSISGNMLACYRTRKEAEDLIEECVSLGWDRDELFINE